MKMSKKLLCLSLCGFILIDTLVKCGLYDYKSVAYAFLTFGLELLMIIVVFYYNLISQSKHGYLNRNSNNKKRSIISFASAFLISSTLLIIRVSIYSRLNEYGNFTWLLLGGIHLLLMLIIGGILYLSFYFASKKSLILTDGENSEKEEKIWKTSTIITFLILLIDIIIKIIVFSTSKDSSNHWHFWNLDNEVGYAFYLFGTESIIVGLFGSIVFLKEIKS